MSDSQDKSRESIDLLLNSLCTDHLDTLDGNCHNFFSGLPYKIAEVSSLQLMVLYKEATSIKSLDRETFPGGTVDDDDLINIVVRQRRRHRNGAAA